MKLISKIWPPLILGALLFVLNLLGLPQGLKLGVGSLSVLIVELLDSRGSNWRWWLLENRSFWPTLALSALVLLLPGMLSGVLVSLLLVGWLSWLRLRPEQAPAAFGNQFFIGWALFLAAGVWQWPDVILLGLVWFTSFVVARQFLLDAGEKASTLLAAAWALICAEVAWVFTIWLVNYLLLGGSIVLPQPAIVLAALGYCFGGIYLAHVRTQLSRGRLAEYLLIGFSLLLIVIAGTKWNGSV